MKDFVDRNLIRTKDITLVITIIGLLGTLWKYSGLDDIKEKLAIHTTQIAVIESEYSGIKKDLDRIEKNTR
jgi:hypothetical protein